MDGFHIMPISKEGGSEGGKEERMLSFQIVNDIQREGGNERRREGSLCNCSFLYFFFKQNGSFVRSILTLVNISKYLMGRLYPMTCLAEETADGKGGDRIIEAPPSCRRTSHPLINGTISELKIAL